MPFFFRGSADHSLFGVLHRPAAFNPHLPAWVFCHPLGEEKLWSHRVLVSYARRLAAAGYPVLRFDLTGHGDSEGQFVDLSVEQACADVTQAIDEVRRQTGVVAFSLLGLRLGATLASLVAERSRDIQQLVLWAPVTDGSRYMHDLLRSNVMTQLAIYKQVQQERSELVAEMERGAAVNVDGYDLGWGLYSTVSAVALGSARCGFTGRCLIVQVDKQLRPAADIQRLAAAYPTAAVRFAQEEPFWKEIAHFYQDAPNLFAATDTWLANPSGQ